LELRANQELLEAKVDEPTLVTVGMFDGVHLGHKYLLNLLKNESTKRNMSPAVLTFRDHPQSILRPESQVPLITSLDDRLSLISNEGINFLVPLTFDQDLSLVGARSFVEMLKITINLRGFLVGPDFALGHKREGTIPVLTALGKEMGFFVSVLDVLELEGNSVRSTNVRNSIKEGNMELAAKLLGRPHSFSAKVVHGEGRGKKLGFPTANLLYDNSLIIPHDGVYATWIEIDGQYMPSATSIGNNPTFKGENITVETFILGFDSDIYDVNVRLIFGPMLREMASFSSSNELVEQMKNDISNVHDALNKFPFNHDSFSFLP
tara:strand:- start:3786 stop:4748 length:963 start_codon:yes stop_codon:yes gene_type:complete